MACLPEDASIDDIESELAFYTAVIQSLDHSDDDYETALQENQATIAQLLELWQKKQSTDASSPSTANFMTDDPSKELDPPISSNNLHRSPLSIRSRDLDTETSSQSSKKRSYQGDHYRRPSPLPSLSNGYTKSFLERQAEAERRANEQLQMELADADYARLLSTSESVSGPSYGINQSYLNPNGQLREMPPPPISSPRPEPSSSIFPPFVEEVSDEAPAVKLEPIPGSWDYYTHPTANFVTDDTDSPNSSADSLLEISREAFEGTMQPGGSSNFALNPSLIQSSSPSLPQTSVSLPHWPGYSIQLHNLLTQQAMKFPRPLQSSVVTHQIPRTFIPTVEPFRIGARSTNPNTPVIKPSYHTSGRTDLDYLYNDPTNSREEIDKLLANIRPDEDLPAEMRGDSPPEMNCKLLEHQKLGLTWLQQQEEGSNKGSILADDMGLGKTIQAIALMVTRRSEDPTIKTNLIVAPVALLRQWTREISEKICRGSKMKVYIYHGPSKAKAQWAFLSGFDVVVTTYGSLASEYRKRNAWESTHNNAILSPQIANKHGIVLLAPHARWHRVILDEAQCIKNPNTKTAIAVTYLNAKYRLCMTGTPMMNNVGELYPLIRFLRISPFNDSTKFNYNFKRPLSENSSPTSRQKAMRSLQILLKAILLRRNKKSKIDGKPILDLKPRTTEVKHAIFSDDEKEFYQHLEHSTRLQVNRYLKANTVGKNYSNILVLLLRLRQACCHPHLIKDHCVTVDADISTNEMENLCQNLAEDVIRRIKDAQGSFECPICFDAVENPAIIYPCGHDLCSECFSRMTDSSTAIAQGREVSDAKCPECRGPANRKQIIDYSVFEKVHMPEIWRQKYATTDEEENAVDDSDSESDSESCTDSDGNLDDFVVDDDEEIEYEESSDAELSAKDARETNGKLDVKVESDDDNIIDRSKRKSQIVSKGEEGSIIKFESDDDNGYKQLALKIQKSRRKIKGKGKGKDKKVKKPPVTLAVLKKESLKNAKAKRRYLRRLRRDWVSSAKVDKTMEILKNIRARDNTEKTIIFSQFTSLLDLIEVPIDNEGWKYRRYDGSMNANARNDAVEAFSDIPDCKIMLVSLKAGNAGLNLTCASQVIILDPFWNPFIEEQAIDRAHRIGQNRPVFIHRVLIKDTVEDRIIALQEKKRQLIEQALDESAARSVSRLGARELRYLFAIDNSLS